MSAAVCVRWTKGDGQEISSLPARPTNHRQLPQSITVRLTREAVTASILLAEAMRCERWSFEEIITMTDILIRNVSDEVLQALKQRAARHRRSLQQELLSILDSAARGPVLETPADVAKAIRSRLAQSGRSFGDSTPLIREDRER